MTSHGKEMTPLFLNSHLSGFAILDSVTLINLENLKMNQNCQKWIKKLNLSLNSYCVKVKMCIIKGREIQSLKNSNVKKQLP